MGALFFAFTSLGMLTSRGDFPSHWCWCYRCGGLVYMFAFLHVFEKAVSKGSGPKLPRPQLSKKNWLYSPYPLHLNVVLGLRRPWYTKLLSKAVTWLTVKRLQEDGQLGVGGHGKKTESWADSVRTQQEEGSKSQTCPDLEGFRISKTS